MKNLLGITFIFFLISLATPGLAQDQFEDMLNMELKELMNIDIYSVSKKSESLYETPLSSSTLTAEDIYNSGATSIPEALRLVPGVIVREMTNGSYDVHLRGFDNLNRFGDASSASNQITLVMVDGRPVFNNNLGGTYWEAIPVDLIDIERIEVVRGPAAALYGPNAVAGVINIITKDVSKEGLTAQANLSAGTDNTQVGGVRLGYKFSDKLTAQISGNVQFRDRQDDQFFDLSQNAYVDSNDRFESAVDRKGVNLMLDYRISEDFSIGLQSGLQRAGVTRAYGENMPVVLSELEHDSEYINLTVNKKGLAGRLSYTSGFDNLNKDNQRTLLQYDYHNIDASVEYTFEVSEALSLRPGLSYQSFTYNDEDYFNLSEGTVGVLGEEQNIDNYAGSLMADIRLTDKWRFVAGGRVDKFSTPDESYFSYELATTYTINDKNIVRVLTSRSNSGSFIAPNFLNLNVAPLFYYQGDQNLELFQVQLFEVGYRAKPVDNLELNIELFRQHGKNTNALVSMQPQTPFVADAEYFEYVNLPLEAVQNGV
ncbi:MAG: TonB-dependent receptor, partial [Bacteroidota bacterium]